MGKKAKKDKGFKKYHKQLTDKEKILVKLSRKASKFKDYGDREFARSLIRSFAKRGDLTQKQWFYATELLSKPTSNRKIRKRSLSKTGKFYIYVVEAGPFIKVGFSDCPAKRLKAIQTSCPHKARVWRTWGFEEERTVRRHEKNLHSLLVDHHEHGEWFKAEAAHEVVLYFENLDSMLAETRGS